MKLGRAIDPVHFQKTFQNLYNDEYDCLIAINATPQLSFDSSQYEECDSTLS